MSFSDRERPRAFWVFAVLSSVAASAPVHPVYKQERPRAFWVFAVLSRARPYHLYIPAYKKRQRAFWAFAVPSGTVTAALLNTIYKQKRERSVALVAKTARGPSSERQHRENEEKTIAKSGNANRR
ncbi:hypothetical protein [Haloparvum sp. PAK95]|uniref:hypothetical protein n=1 Tax=Haloparvum sp. PAK95 TaxID=3418962 RepID=UPI003D2EEA48